MLSGIGDGGGRGAELGKFKYIQTQIPVSNFNSSLASTLHFEPYSYPHSDGRERLENDTITDKFINKISYTIRYSIIEMHIFEIDMINQFNFNLNMIYKSVKMPCPG